MILVGIFRGTGGFLLIIQGKMVNTGLEISASGNQTVIAGTGLIIVLILFLISAFFLLKDQSKTGWNTGWIAITFFILDGLLNGYLLFGAPRMQGQLINVIVGILIGISLILGRKALKNKTS
jgi:hypothetical protein